MERGKFKWKCVSCGHIWFSNREFEDLCPLYLCESYNIYGIESSEMTHKLKILPNFFKDVKSDVKTFEIRKNDRDFRVGDKIILKEWDKESGKYTGQEVTKIITYCLTNNEFQGIKDGYCVFGFGNDIV